MLLPLLGCAGALLCAARCVCVVALEALVPDRGDLGEGGWHAACASAAIPACGRCSIRATLCFDAVLCVIRDVRPGRRIFSGRRRPHSNLQPPTGPVPRSKQSHMPLHRTSSVLHIATKCASLEQSQAVRTRHSWVSLTYRTPSTAALSAQPTALLLHPAGYDNKLGRSTHAHPRTQRFAPEPTYRDTCLNPPSSTCAALPRDPPMWP